MDDFDDVEGERSPLRVVGWLAVVALIVTGGYALFSRLRDDTPSRGTGLVLDDRSAAGGPTEASTAPPSSSIANAPTGRSGPSTTIAVGARATTTTAVDDRSSSASTTTTTSTPTSAPTTDPAGGAAAGSDVTTTVAVAQAAPPAATASYPTLPDGSPVPVLAMFEADRITLSGVVPSQAAADRLAALALANARTPVPVVQYLAIDPTVPANVGVRVVELTSTRFPEGSAEIVGPHAAEIDRVATVLQALPHVTALVVGHADQRGSEDANFAISEARAQAVVAHLVNAGIAASRLSSRAVGENDLLTLNDDAAAFELNRRTEFIFTGILLDPAPEPPAGG